MSKILQIAADTNFYLYRKPVKMSRSFDGLAALIRTELNKDIISGDVFIFFESPENDNKNFTLRREGFYDIL